MHHHRHQPISSIHHYHNPWVCTVYNYRPCCGTIGTNKRPPVCRHHSPPETQNRWHRDDRNQTTPNHHRATPYGRATPRIAPHTSRHFDEAGTLRRCGLAAWRTTADDSLRDTKNTALARYHRRGGQSQKARHPPFHRRLLLRGTHRRMVLRHHCQRNDDNLVVRRPIILDGCLYY